MIWIVRHGRTEANASGLLLGRADPELDSVGLDQAARIAKMLPAGGICYTSPLKRTAGTAAAYSSDAIEDHRLLELDYGDFDLRPLADIPSATWDEWRSDVTFRPPAGETLAELGERIGSFLTEVSTEAIERDVVLFTHVSPIKAAVAWALGTDMSISWRTHVAQASITRISVSARGPSLQLFNATDHLAGLS